MASADSALPEHETDLEKMLNFDFMDDDSPTLPGHRAVYFPVCNDSGAD